MKKSRAWSILAMVGLAGSISLVASCGPNDEPPSSSERVAEVPLAATVPPIPPPGINPIICMNQAFTEVTWNICMIKTAIKGVWVMHANIQRTPGGPFFRVLAPSGPAEIFVPYHENPPFRPYDLNPYAYMDPISIADVGPGGSVLTFPGDTQPLLGKEIRDRGPAYLCKSPTGSKVRRGKELVLWSVYDVGNYDYIVQYSFRDDGAITFRVGATGYNNPERPFEAHMHNVLWRVNPDIAGPANNVFIDDHVEVPNPNPSLAVDLSTPVVSESFIDWQPFRFRTLRVASASAVNAWGNSMSYVLEPHRYGTSRHYNAAGDPGLTEHFTQHDFAVTKYNAGELGWIAPPNLTHPKPDDYLLTQLGYTAGPPPAGPVTAESVADSDVVLWYVSSAHHHVVDEDRPNFPGAPGPGHGITLIHWTGFDFVPHDFFDYNPLGGPTRCEPYCGDGTCNAPAEDCCTCSTDCGGVSCC